MNTRLIVPILLVASFSAHGEQSGKVCIAHGGAGAYAPFNSMASFQLALTMKPDYIETDLQLTKDGVLVCFHDVSLNRLTDVKEVFPDRFSRDATSAPKAWYVNDFTLAEIKQLDFGSWFDAKFEGERIATFQELIDLTKGRVGLYPETKDPEFYAARGLSIDVALHEILVQNGLDTREGQKDTPIIIQSFHESSLRRLRELSGDNYTLVQLVWFGQWNEFMTDEGLEHVATYADGIGPFLSMILPPNTSIIQKAHELGLVVHPWKLYEAFPPDTFADITTYTRFLLHDIGVDGLFTEYPDQFPKSP